MRLVNLMRLEKKPELVFGGGEDVVARARLLGGWLLIFRVIAALDLLLVGLGADLFLSRNEGLMVVFTGVRHSIVYVATEAW